MNPHVIEDAWEQAKLLLVVGGKEWPIAFDAPDIARLSMEAPLRADALVAALRDVPASGGWCCRDSNIVGHYQTDTGGIDGPASFPVWRRGNDLHYLLVANGRKEQMIARRMHTADDMREFYLTREQDPPGLLAAWIASKSELTASKEAHAALPVSGARPATGTTHKLKGRTNVLRAVLDMAKENAPDHLDPHNVWATLVALAEAEQPPAPLVGFSSDGVQYRGKNYDATGVPDVLTRKQLSDRMYRERKRAKAR